MERLQKALARIGCITSLDEVATLHLGPGAILVALTPSFRRDSTTDMIEDAIREITQALQKRRTAGSRTPRQRQTSSKDHGPAHRQTEFKVQAWRLANDKARELGWIV